MAYDYRIDSWNKEVAAKEKQETTEQGPFKSPSMIETQHLWALDHTH